MALGVPAEQIAFVHDAGDNPAKREQLFAKVRSGEIRVLMGSTQKLGTGTNVQERLAAIHDLDCPCVPPTWNSASAASNARATRTATCATTGT